MSHRTNWIPFLRKSGNATHFLINSLFFHTAHGLARSLFPKKRTPGTVMNNYDQERAKLSARLLNTDWESYVEFDAELSDYVVIDDKVTWTSLRVPRKLLMDRLVQTVSAYTKAGETVIEFGSGDGRNLLFLQKKFPDRKFVGVELSPASVNVSYEAAKKFAVPGVRFYAANACEPLPDIELDGPVGLIYSSFALEQMPRIFVVALENMVSLKPGAIALFEPVPELWNTDLRGRVSRLRVKAIDRLRDVPQAITALCKNHPEYQVVKMERSGLAINPHTEMCEILLSTMRAD